MHAVAYTGVTAEPNVTSASRGLVNSTYVLSVVRQVWALLVLITAGSQAYDATLWDVETLYCEMRIADAGDSSVSAMRCLFFPFV